MNLKAKKTFLLLMFSLCLMLGLSHVLLANDYSWKRVDDNYRAITYSGRWLQSDTTQSYGQSERMADHSNFHVEFTFVGSGFQWIGSKGLGRGKADVYLNEKQVGENIDLYLPKEEYQQVLFTLVDLPEGEHTVRIVPTGTKSDGATIPYITIDAFEYVPTFNEALADAKEAFKKARLEPTLQGSLYDYYSQEAISSLQNALDIFGSVDESDLLPEERKDAINQILKAHNFFTAANKLAMFQDYSGNNNSVRAYNGPEWEAGKFGNAIQFNKNVGYLIAEPSETLAHPDNLFTVELWLYVPSGNKDWGGAFAYGTQEYGAEQGMSRLLIRHDIEGNIYLHLGNGTSKVVGEAVNIGWKYDTWQHIAMTYDYVDLKVYVDGELKVTRNTPNVEISNGIGTVLFGAQNVGTRYFSGLVDEARLWNVARTEEEIKETMNQELAGDEAGLIGYWKFDELYK